jgi:predicted ribosome quality control (RQC) complex YloA/Tae2 family protein
LLHIAREINGLSGWAVDDCFTQDKDNLVISLNDGKRESFIVFICDGKYDSIYLQKSFGKSRSNAVSLLPDIEGDVLQSAEVVGKSRIIKIKFLHSTVFAVLFGGIHSNFLLLNSGGLVLDSFNSGQTKSGKNFKPPAETLMKITEFPRDTEIKSALAHSDYLFGNTYTNEVLSRINSEVTDENSDINPSLKINPKTKISELSDAEFREIIRHSELLKSQLENSHNFFVLEDSSHRKIMSPVKLIGYNLLSEYDSASEAVHRKTVSDYIDSKFKNEYSTIKSYLEKQKRKYDKAIENMQDLDSAKKRESEYRLWAEILMSQPNVRDKAGEKINLTDWDGLEHVIKLDPKLKLADNAKKYFDKAHSTNEDIRIRKERLPEMLSKQEAINNKLAELETVRHLKELSKFESGIKEATGRRVNSKKMTMEEKFRKFDLGEGYFLYAGKNASNNDELTMKFAKPNDVWLHARGSSGSHTVIRMDKEEKPPKAVLQKAAEITAYYSGARNAKYVPVIWTFKKYVRKPKGANVGSVIVAKETVIMAEPKLPEGEK